MLFSILIAHYNNWVFFQDCYKSIKKQTYQNYEIIIVDDCSTDNSFQHLLELAKKDSRIKLFRNEVNSKVGYTKRRCIKEASGDICGFLDPDDFLENHAIEASLDAYKNHQCIATYSRIKLVGTNAEQIGIFKNTKAIKQRQKLFFNINFEVAHFFTFRKEMYLKTSGINNNLIISEDQDLYLKLYEKGEVHIINDILYNYRLHTNGISQNKNKTQQQREDWHNVILETCKRRDIKKLYGKSVDAIPNLPKFIYEKENSFLKKLLRKLN